MKKIKQLLKRKSKGFTMLETVLYVAMSSVILGVAMLLLYSLVQYRAQDKIRRDVDSEILRILEYMGQNIRNAQHIEVRDGVGIPVYSGYGEAISIDTLNINNTQSNLLIYGQSNKIKVEKSTGIIDLNSGLVNISNLQFRYLTDGGGGISPLEIVDIEFTAAYAWTGATFYEYSRDVTVSVKLR
jgi:type II secretory pathway pseudopilin PulG